LRIIAEEDSKTSDISISIQRIKLDQSQIDLSREDKTPEEIKALLISILIEKITGKKIKLTSLSDLKESIYGIEPVNIPQTGIQLDYKRINYQQNYIKFFAEGYIKTEDNKQVRFEISFELNRSELQVEHLDVKAGSLALIDPLIINFDGDLSDMLSDKYFEFDIDSDDKNGNGRIDNGGELFGTKTGDGFKELSHYDTDKNSWIDENDTVFDRLGVWIKNSHHDRIYSLKEKGIGCI